MENFKKLPVIALRSMTILPDTMIHFDLIRKKSILAAEQAMSEDQEVFLVTQCHAETEDPQAEDLYQIGCIAKVKQVTKLPDKTTYNVKDTFDPTGMQVTAYYANGMTRDVTKYVTWSDKPLKASDTDFQITFPYAMYQNRENSDTLEMEYGVHCDKPMTTLTLTIGDQTEVKYGDVNGNGKVDSTDAAIVYRYANGKYQLSADQLLAADVNGDGVVNTTDAALIYRVANGKLSKFPVEQ